MFLQRVVEARVKENRVKAYKEQLSTQDLYRELGADLARVFRAQLAGGKPLLDPVAKFQGLEIVEDDRDIILDKQDQPLKGRVSIQSEVQPGDDTASGVLRVSTQWHRGAVEGVAASRRKPHEPKLHIV